MAAQIKPFPTDDPKLPPHNIDAEMAVIGAILTDPGALDRVRDRLSIESFYHGGHAKIYAAALELSAKNQPVDFISISDLLKAKDQLEPIGGKMFLANLIADPIASINADLHAELIAEKHVRRKLIATARQIAELAYSQAIPLKDVIDQAEGSIYQITNQQNLEGVHAEHISESCMRVYQANEAGISPGIQTNFYDLDALTGGLFPGQLITVAAATAMGKTHFAIAQAFEVAHQGYPVLIFTCEMTADELNARFNARLSGIDSSVISRCEVMKQGEASMESLLSATTKLSELPIYIVDVSNPSPAEMRGQIRRVAADAGMAPKLVVLDYLQLLGNGENNRVREIDLISRACKAIAKDFNLSFMALAQINRGVENRANKRPNLGDLRESGAIEQNSNRVIFLYREDYYDPDTVDRQIIELIVAKNRGGKTGMVKMLFTPEYTYFKDIARRYRSF